MCSVFFFVDTFHDDREKVRGKENVFSHVYGRFVTDIREKEKINLGGDSLFCQSPPIIHCSHDI